MRCSGQGTVYLANLAQYVHVVDVDQEGLTVDSSYVLALDSTLHTEVIAVDSQYGISGSGKYQLNITGRGKVALMTSGQPLMMQVTPDKYVNADADAIVAWSTSLRVQMQAQTALHRSLAAARQHRRGLGAELPRHRLRAGAAQRGAAAAERPARTGRRRAVRHGPARRPRAEPEQRLELTSPTVPARRRGGPARDRPFAASARAAQPPSRAKVASSSRTTEVSATSATSSYGNQRRSSDSSLISATAPAGASAAYCTSRCQWHGAGIGCRSRRTGPPGSSVSPDAMPDSSRASRSAASASVASPGSQWPPICSHMPSFLCRVSRTRPRAGSITSALPVTCPARQGL